jgi:hypothetical protein
MPETLADRPPDVPGRDVGERARDRHAARERGGANDVEIAEPPAADGGAGQGDLGARAEQVGARLDGGEIDEATHDAELRHLLRDADPTQGDPTQAMDVADRIRDPERREWTQANLLGRYADAQGYPTDELAGFAAELETDTGIDGFVAGLPAHRQTPVREALDRQAHVPDTGDGPAVSSDVEAAGPPAVDGTIGDGELVAQPERAVPVERVGASARWPVPDEAEWTSADRELFREAASVGREREHGVISDATHDARLQQLALRAEPTRAGWEITDRIRDPAPRAETRADLAGAVARAGDRTTAWAMADSIESYVTDSHGRQIRSHALAEVAQASDTRAAAYELVDGIEDPRTQREVREILADAESVADLW